MQTPIAPPASAPTGTGTATPLPSGTGTVPSLPPSLATALQNTGTLMAQVSARPQPGQVTLALPGGQSVTVNTPLPLPVGTNLAVSLQNAGPPATLQLQPQTTGQQSAQLGNQSLPLPTGAQGGATTAGTTGAQPSVVTTLSQGSVFSATVTGPPTAATTPTTQSAQQAGPNAPPVPSQTTQAVLPPGSTVQLRLLAFAPQGQLLSGLGTPGTLAGTVTGQGPGGTVTISTPMGNLSAQLSSTPPTGTQLLLNTVGQPSLPTPGSGVGAEGGVRYQALQDAVALLRGGDPGAAQRLTQSLIPQPNAQLGLAAVFLVGAMRQGGLDKWMGNDGMRALTEAGAGKSGLISRMEGDMRQATGRATDGAGQEWKVTTLPFLDDRQLDQIRLYTKDAHDPDEEENGSSDEAKRFVVEANFSRIGPIQLDGLSREKQIDLMIRTRQPLAAEERDGIRGLFADTVSALGFGGRVEFSVVQRFDLVPDGERHSPAYGGFSV